MKIRLMTSNIWGDFFGNPVGPRAPLLEKVFERYVPDILGLQEVGKNWWASTLIDALQKRYTQVPVETQGKLNCNPIFYDAERFELLECSFHLFHEELDYSKGWNCGVFREKESKGVLAVYNTHFWWKADLNNDVIRRYNAMETICAMKETAAKYDCKVFLMGDMNCKCDSLAWNYVRQQGWETSFFCTEQCSACSSNHHDPKIHEDGSCTGSTTDEPKENSIDHIAIPAGVRVLCQHAVTDREALDSSDHSPVYADVIL